MIPVWALPPHAERAGSASASSISYHLPELRPRPWPGLPGAWGVGYRYWPDMGRWRVWARVGGCSWSGMSVASMVPSAVGGEAASGGGDPAGAFDVHRCQLTCEYLDTSTGEL